jgi:hypothetical protein
MPVGLGWGDDRSINENRPYWAFLIHLYDETGKNRRKVLIIATADSAVFLQLGIHNLFLGNS